MFAVRLGEGGMILLNGYAHEKADQHILVGSPATQQNQLSQNTQGL
jgi:hypothetical protein